MKRTRPTHAARGFSLVEMAVVLTILGTIGLAMWRLLPVAGQAASSASGPAVLLSRAEQAVIGFARLHGRLPCPDTAGNGLENCASPAQTGWLPARSLGIVLPQRLRYGVSRQNTGGVNLTAAQARFTPDWPARPEPPEFPEWPKSLAWPNDSSSEVNGLDLCAGLRSAARAPGASALVGAPGGVPLAFALAHPGAIDADGDGNPFDGANTGAGTIADPSTAHSTTYDDLTRTVGFGRLAAGLGCVEKLSAAQAAHRSAWADYDHYRIAVAYEQFRRFGVNVRTMNRDMAIANVTIAGIDLIMATATSAMSVSIAVSAVGSAAPAVAAAVIAVGAATANVGVAATNLGLAEAALSKANQQYGAAIDYRTDVAEPQLAASLDRAEKLDQRGLQ